MTDATTLCDMSTLLVVLLIGATARLTRLATTDAIFEAPRLKIERRLPEKLAYLIRCDWCTSAHVGFAVFALGWYAPDTAVLIASGALTASLVTGWLHSIAQVVDAKLWGDE